MRTYSIILLFLLLFGCSRTTPEQTLQLTAAQQEIHEQFGEFRGCIVESDPKFNELAERLARTISHAQAEEITQLSSEYRRLLNAKRQRERGQKADRLGRVGNLETAEARYQQALGKWAYLRCDNGAPLLESHRLGNLLELAVSLDPPLPSHP